MMLAHGHRTSASEIEGVLSYWYRVLVYAKLAKFCFAPGMTSYLNERQVTSIGRSAGCCSQGICWLECRSRVSVDSLAGPDGWVHWLQRRQLPLQSSCQASRN
jgi:hypothetical protein